MAHAILTGKSWVLLENLMVNLLIGKVKMVLEWREREHEDMDRVSMGDPMTLHALWRCRLLKFYRTSNMRVQVWLLEVVVHL